MKSMLAETSSSCLPECSAASGCPVCIESTESKGCHIILPRKQRNGNEWSYEREGEARVEQQNYAQLNETSNYRKNGRADGEIAV